MNTIVINGNWHALPDEKMAAKVEALPEETLQRRLEHVESWNRSGRTYEGAGPFQPYVALLMDQEYYLHAEKARRAASVNGGGI